MYPVTVLRAPYERTWRTPAAVSAEGSLASTSVDSTVGSLAVEVGTTSGGGVWGGMDYYPSVSLKKTGQK